MVEQAQRATVKLNLIDQDVFSSFDRAVVYPVPNKWGSQGWTNINLALIESEMLQDILVCAYCTVAPKRLADQVAKASDRSGD